MPVLEAATYGYTLENRHTVAAFREGEDPPGTFHDEVAVVEMLMALYRSAEIGSTVHLSAEELKTYVTPVSRSEYQGWESVKAGRGPPRNTDTRA
jgi:hypothetical protein